MFKAPFSFNGRISRKEYLITVAIYFGACFVFGGILGVIFALSGISTESNTAQFAFIAAVIPIYWFGLAQGARRCHDLGHSGWWQLIPFYIFWMLFQTGNYGMNEYGPDPKNPTVDQFSFEGAPVEETVN